MTQRDAPFSTGHGPDTADDATLRMPAEWTPHERCLMAWPTREDFWGETYAAAKAEYAAVARAISAFEPVLMVVRPGDEADARGWLDSGVEIVELPIDDSWLRDSGPIFVTAPDGRRAGVDFRFNSWGERFLPYGDDACVTARLLARLGERRLDVPMVLEGGAITVDGEGTLITTEQCLLNPNRNPNMTRAEIEETLRRALGVTTIIWLPYGLREDSMTDGHVDGVCAFIGPGTVLLQTTRDEHDSNHARLEGNRRRLAQAHDAAGRRLEILELPYIAAFEVAGQRVGGCYLNVYVANGGVVAPLYDLPTDEAVLNIVRSAFPNREIVGMPARTIAFGGGGIHCITQQVPLASATT